MKFNTEFWNETPGTFNGSCLILEKTRLGAAVVQQYIDFYREITTAMDVFAQSVDKAAKVQRHKDSGTMFKAGEVMIQEFSKMAANCREASKTIEKELTKAAEFLKSSESSRKDSRESFRVVQDNLMDSMKKTDNLQRSAMVKLKEMRKAKAQENIKTKERTNTAATEKHKRKSEESFNLAESLYKASVKPLNSDLDKYKCISSEQFCKLQEIEENRIKLLRENIWMCSNIFSQLAVFIDSHMETIRTTVAEIDIDSDIINWIASNRTGQEFPDDFIYRPSHSLRSSDELSTGNSLKTFLNIEDDEEEDVLKPIRKGYCAFNFLARSDSEACIKRGEKVQVLHEEQSEWILIRKNNGEEGFVPKQYVASSKK